MKHTQNAIYFPVVRCDTATAAVIAGMTHVKERRETITEDVRLP